MLLGPRFDVDFVRAPRIAPLAGWLLAAGLIAAVCAGAWCEREWRAGRELSAQLDDLNARAARDRDQAARQRPPVATGDPQVQAQALDVLAELHRPWRALFDQLEADRVRGVHLDQLTIDARFEGLQVQAEARSLADVLDFVRELPGSGPIVGVQLANHEVRAVPIGHVVSARIAARVDATAVH